MLINNEFNKLQINETIEKDANGNVFKRSLMFNIRSNSVEEADRLYRQLKARFNGKPNAAGQAQNAAGNSGDSNAPTCGCGRRMVLRNGSNGPFYGCSGFPQCKKTREVNEVAEEVAVVQVDEAPVF